MLNDERQFSFLCNPAAWMHPNWRAHLMRWDIPEGLAEILWTRRAQSGELSRFLAERFELHPTSMLDIEESTQHFLLMDIEPFEACLVRLGMIFLSPRALYILDGAHLRRLKEEFGQKDFLFMRHEALHLLEAKHEAKARSDFSVSESFSKKTALIFGLAAFLKKLPVRGDILTRLWLKLPPLAEEPAAPAGFAQVRAQLDHIGVLKPDAMSRIFDTPFSEEAA